MLPRAPYCPRWRTRRTQSVHGRAVGERIVQMDAVELHNLGRRLHE